MGILLTNGKCYIAVSSSGKTSKVTDIKKAKDFISIESAIAHKNKAPGKCAGYYFIDTDIAQVENENRDNKIKRKSFSVNERIKVYRKTKGHCYLCGEFIDFDSFEIEHKVPISKGGTNDLDNLFCSCHCCNTIKQDIYPEDFMEKISQIFIYQAYKKNKNSFRWKILNRELRKLL